MMENKKIGFGLIGIILIVFISECTGIFTSCPSANVYSIIESGNTTILTKEEAFDILKTTFENKGYGKSYYEGYASNDFEYKEVETNAFNKTDYINYKTYLWVLPTGIGIDSIGNIHRAGGCA